MRGARATRRRPRRGLRIAAVTPLALFALACGDMILDDRALDIDATGTVEGFAYLDVDGNGTYTGTGTGTDAPAVGIGIRLVPAGGGGAVATATTDETGLFRAEAVPVGSLRFVLDAATVPDSVAVLDIDSEPFTLARGALVERNLRLSFPTVPLPDVRDEPAGRRIFTHGIVLNARVPLGDRTLHLNQGSVALRATEVERTPVVPGDSVRVLGTTSIEADRPVLTNVRVFAILSQAALVVPVDVTAAEAATALDGARDAALARVRDAEVLDTASVGGDLAVTVNDGSGAVEVVLRGFIDFDRTAIRPGQTTLAQATGLLVPVRNPQGVVRWQLTPRAPADLVVVPND